MADLKSGTIFQHFYLIKKIDEGSNGPVFHALDTRCNKPVIIKFVRRYEQNVKTSLEMEIQSLIYHRNIVEMYCAFEFGDKYTCLVLEYIEGMDLYDYIEMKRSLKEEEAYLIFVQVYSAIKYLHSNSIIHRDIKPENILIRTNNKNWGCNKVGRGVGRAENNNNNNLKFDYVKVCDFGFTTFYNKSKLLTLSCGSLNHAPPEILRGDSYVGPEVDVWCLGSCLYMMITGVQPTRNREEICYLKTFDKKKFIFSENLESLLRRTLDNNPKTRITMREIEEHPWMNLENCNNSDNKLINPFLLNKEQIEFTPVYCSWLLNLIKSKGYNLKNISKVGCSEYHIYKMLMAKIIKGYSTNDIFFLSGFIGNKGKKYSLELEKSPTSCLSYLLCQSNYYFTFTFYCSIQKLKIKIEDLILRHNLKIKTNVGRISKSTEGRLILKKGILEDFKRLVILLIR